MRRPGTHGATTWEPIKRPRLAKRRCCFPSSTIRPVMVAPSHSLVRTNHQERLRPHSKGLLSSPVSTVTCREKPNNIPDLRGKQTQKNIPVKHAHILLRNTLPREAFSKGQNCIVDELPEQKHIINNHPSTDTHDHYGGRGGDTFPRPSPNRL